MVQHLMRRQARWVLYLSHFDFVITHKPGTSNECADALSCCVDHCVDDADDNIAQVVLRLEQIRIVAAQRGYAFVIADKAVLHKIRVCPMRDMEVIEALRTVRQLGPAGLCHELVNWNIEQGLLLYRGKVYVLKDVTLRTEIVKTHHNLSPAGHPCQAKMLELVSWNYWWPNMGKFIKDYIDMCNTCRRSKPAWGKPHGQLKPNEIPNGPGQIITCDYIIGLPLVDGYNSIQIMVNHHGKLAHLVPCNEEINAEGVVHIYKSMRPWSAAPDLGRGYSQNDGYGFRRE